MPNENKPGDFVPALTILAAIAAAIYGWVHTADLAHTIGYAFLGAFLGFIAAKMLRWLAVVLILLVLLAVLATVFSGVLKQSFPELYQYLEGSWYELTKR